MFETIHWRCHVRAADRRKVEREIGPPERREFSGVAAGAVGARFLVPGVEWMEFSLVGGV